MTAGNEGILIMRVGRVHEQWKGTEPWDGRFRGQRVRIAQAYGMAFVRGYARAFVRAYGKTFVRKYGRLCPHAYAELFVPAFTEAFARSYAESLARAFVEACAEERAESNEAVARVVLGHRGTEVSAAFPEDLPAADRTTLAQASPAAVAAAAFTASSLADFLHRLRNSEDS